MFADLAMVFEAVAFFIVLFAGLILALPINIFKALSKINKLLMSASKNR